MDRKKIIYAVLRRINEGDKVFDYNDFDLSEEIYSEVLKLLIVENLIADVVEVKRIHKSYKTYRIDNAVITLKGVQFLEENKTFAKWYKIAKETASWIPGVG